MSKIAINSFGRICRIASMNTLKDYGIEVSNISVHNPLHGKEYKLYNVPAVTLPSFSINNRHERCKLEKVQEKNNKRNSNYTQPRKRKQSKKQ